MNGYTYIFIIFFQFIYIKIFYLQKIMTCCNYCQVETVISACACGKVSYCGVNCQKSDWKSHKPACPPYKIKKVSGKGRGIIATRKINVGEIIIDEYPLMVIDSPGSEVVVDVFKDEFAKINDDVKKIILSLFDPLNDELKLEMKSSIKEIEKSLEKQKEGETDEFKLNELTDQLESLNADLDAFSKDEKDESETALRIFSGNSVQVCEVSSLYSSTEGGLYHNISLLNHSCNPNSVWSWVQDDFRRKIVRAVKPIKKGEEVLANYVDTEEFNFGSRDHRRSVLVDKFGFICKCSECTLDGEEWELNEQNRKDIVSNINLIKELMKKYEGQSTVSALKAGEETVRITKEIGLVYEIPRLLLNCYQVATAARYQNIIGMINPTIYSEQARYYSENFGDSFMYFYNFVTRPG